MVSSRTRSPQRRPTEDYLHLLTLSSGEESGHNTACNTDALLPVCSSWHIIENLYKRHVHLQDPVPTLTLRDGAKGAGWDEILQKAWPS